MPRLRGEGCESPRLFQTEFFQAITHGAERDPQFFRGGGSVPAGFFQGLENGLFLQVAEIIAQRRNTGRLHAGVVPEVAVAARQVQILGIDDVPLAQRQRTLEDILQFTDIAREGITGQGFEGACAQAGGRQFGILRQAFEDVFGKQGNIVGACPQRRATRR